MAPSDGDVNLLSHSFLSSVPLKIVSVAIEVEIVLQISFSVKRSQVESYVKDTGMAGLASAWAMARRMPRKYTVAR